MMEKIRMNSATVVCRVPPHPELNENKWMLADSAIDLKKESSFVLVPGSTTLVNCDYKVSDGTIFLGDKKIVKHTI